MLRKPFRPFPFAWFAPAPDVQALAVLRWNDCRDYLDAMCAESVAGLRAACDRGALEWAASYDGPMRITRQGIAAVAAIMLADCVAMAAEWDGPPRWMPPAEHAAMRRGAAGFRSPSVRRPW